MVEKLIKSIVESIQDNLQPAQIDRLQDVLKDVFQEYEIREKKEIVETGWREHLEIFLARKRTDGKSDGTIKQYRLHLEMMLKKLKKDIRQITEDDLLLYLDEYRQVRKVSNLYIDHIRLVFSSFFGWLQRKRYIQSNPAAGLEPIKYRKTVKKPFTAAQLEQLRCQCQTERDLAILELLYSTGVRVSELVGLNRDEISFQTGNIIVLGKGNKERETYLNAKAHVHLKRYLSSRTDSSPALFVSMRKSAERLSVAAIEDILRKLGHRAGIAKVHPHRFRRTAATDLLNMGMPIEQVKEFLGHSKLDTTMIYCVINQESVKFSHKKYMNA